MYAVPYEPGCVNRESLTRERVQKGNKRWEWGQIVECTEMADMQCSVGVC